MLQIKSCPSHFPKILREWNHESDSLESVEAEEIERERNIGEKWSIVCFNWAEYLLTRLSDGCAPVQNRESCVLIARKKYSASAKRNRLHPKRALPLWDCLSPIEYFFSAQNYSTTNLRTHKDSRVKGWIWSKDYNILSVTLCRTQRVSYYDLNFLPLIL